MSWINTIKNHLPLIRTPKETSVYEEYLEDNKWITESRDKTSGVGWNTYYKAMKNVWVNACINVITNEILNLEYRISNSLTEGTHGEKQLYLENLFAKPMGYGSSETFSSLITKIVRSRNGLGDAFVEVIINPDLNIPIGFNFIPTQYMQYYKDTEQFGLRNKPDVRFEPDQLIHIHKPSIDGSVWGPSPVDIIAGELTLQLLGRRHSNKVLQADGFSPRGVLEYDKDISLDAWNSEIKRLKAESTKNSKGTLIVRGAKYSNAAATNQDMEFSELMKDTRDCIIATFGVPPSKVSIIETANLGSGSGKSQSKNFKKTIKADTNLISDEFNRILSTYGFDERLKFSELDIEDENERSEIEDRALRNGSITINEVRATYNREPVEWGDSPMNYQQYAVQTNPEDPLAIVPLGSNEEEVINNSFTNVRNYKNKIYKSELLSEWK